MYVMVLLEKLGIMEKSAKIYHVNYGMLNPYHNSGPRGHVPFRRAWMPGHRGSPGRPMVEWWRLSRDSPLRCRSSLVDWWIHFTDSQLHSGTIPSFPLFLFFQCR